MRTNPVMPWDEVYELWNDSAFWLSKTLNDPVSALVIPVKWKDQGTHFRGYDWRKKEDADRTISIIQENVYSFLIGGDCTYKGTLHTAKLLNKACSEEERAAIWIAATAFELKDRERSDHCFYRMFYEAAIGYLRSEHEIWHHSMRKLVPDVPIGCVLPREDQPCKDRAMDSICLNVLLLKESHKIVYCSSLEEDWEKGMI